MAHAHDASITFVQNDSQELIKDSMAVKDREIGELNARLVADQQARQRRPQPRAGSSTSSSSSSSSRAVGQEGSLDDDVEDPAFQEWVRSSGMTAEALFERDQQLLQQQPAGVSAGAAAAQGAAASGGPGGGGSPPRTWCVGT